MVTIQISGANYRRSLLEVQHFVGVNRLYSKGADRNLYADYPSRAEADLVVVNLNTVPDVKARILGDPPAE